MEAVLMPQTFPVSITNGFIQKGPISIVMQCHDRAFTDVEVRDESGELLFTVDCKGMIASWSWRRIVKDITGTPLFQLRKFFHYGVGSWKVESPSGREICSMKHASFRYAQAVDVVVQNEEDEGKEVMVEVRPKDQSALTTLVNIRGATIAEIQLVENNSSSKLDKSVWRARIAGGVDLCLIVAIMLCRAEMRHIYKQ